MIAPAVGFLALAPAAHAQPDFAVKSVRIPTPKGQLPYIFQDRLDGGLFAHVKVANEGDSTAAGGGKLIVSGLGTLSPALVKFDVPKIKPEHSRAVDVEVRQSDLAGITQYRTKACASTKKDSKAHNNCRNGPMFAVLPRTWVGSTNATLFNGFVTQSVVANHVTFTFKDDPTSGTYVWVPTGSVTVTITGDTDPDCSYSGSADLAIDPARASLVMTADLLNYRIASLDLGSYPAVAACTTGTVPFDQEVGPWVQSETTARDADDETIIGTHPSGLGDVWNWSLAAE